MSELTELTGLVGVGHAADLVRTDLETLWIRGLAASSAKDRRGLEARTEEWERIGAHHVASRLRAALLAADGDAKDTPSKFLSAYTSLHAFERVLSLQAAKDAWAAANIARGATCEAPNVAPHEAHATRKAQKAQPLPPIDDPKGAARLLEELTRVVEDLVRTGLTSATPSTRTKLDSAFKDASRRRLLRLGASLRYVNEEIGRFLAGDGTFAARRYAFFLHRSWLLARGTLVALQRNDGTLFSSLTVGTSAPPRPVGNLEVVTLGVLKRIVASACTFDFRLRVVQSQDASLLGKSLVFSLVFARKEGVAAEAYLHLPQPQKFRPKIFCERTQLAITEAALLLDERTGGGRLVLGPKSTVAAGAPFASWLAHATWDPDGAARRVETHAPSPLDLAVEMVEEVVLESWTLAQTDTGGRVISARGLELNVHRGNDTADLFSRLDDAAKKKEKPALFGTVHYEFGKLVLLPLSFLLEEGPRHLMLSDEKINLTALLGSLNIGG